MGAANLQAPCYLVQATSSILSRQNEKNMSLQVGVPNTQSPHTHTEIHTHHKDSIAQSVKARSNVVFALDYCRLCSIHTFAPALPTLLPPCQTNSHPPKIWADILDALQREANDPRAEGLHGIAEGVVYKELHHERVEDHVLCHDL